MTESDMQKAWALIKRKAFYPTKREQDKWINTLNRFCASKIGGTPDIKHNKKVEMLDFKIFKLEEVSISAKSNIVIHSLIEELPTKITLHSDIASTFEYSDPKLPTKLSSVVKTEKDMIKVLRNYINHPMVHLHLLDNGDFHEIRIVSGTDNFFYLMYQAFFQVIDFTNRYENSRAKKDEIERLANVLWGNRENIHPIAPGILFPIGKIK